MAACIPLTLLTIFLYRKSIIKLHALGLLILSFIPVINIISTVVQTIFIMEDYFPNAVRNIIEWFNDPISKENKRK